MISRFVIKYISVKMLKDSGVSTQSRYIFKVDISNVVSHFDFCDNLLLKFIQIFFYRKYTEMEMRTTTNSLELNEPVLNWIKSTFKFTLTGINVKWTICHGNQVIFILKKAMMQSLSLNFDLRFQFHAKTKF